MRFSAHNAEYKRREIYSDPVSELEQKAIHLSPPLGSKKGC
jgi:hypothetical protein